MSRSPALALLLPLLLLPAVAAADGAAGRVVSVTGVGRVFSAPDVVHVVAGVTTRAANTREAVDGNNAAMRRLFALLKQNGIAESDYRTRGFTFTPYFGRRAQGGERRIAGYQVRNRLEIRLRDLSALGGLLDRLIGAGANTIEGIRFAIDDPEPLLARARKAAFADARRRAALYAAAAGVKLGAVLRIAERTVRMPQPRMVALSEARAGAAVPIARGQQEIQATVDVTFALE